MRSKFLFIVILGWALTINSAFSQYTRGKSNKGFTKHEKLQFTAGIGLTSYYGDLCDKFECMQFRPNIGIGAIYRLMPHISARVDLNYYRLYSKDVWTERNINFRSGNAELYVGGIYDLYPYTRHVRKRKKIQPFVFAGVGITYFNPYGQDPLSGKWVALRPLKTEGQSTPYMPVTIIVPYGGGFKFKFKPKYDFIFELAYRKTFTDYLDDVSVQNYANLGGFTDELAARMSMKSTTDPNQYGSYANMYESQYRGNPTKLDGYFLFQAKVRYTVGAKNVVFKGKHPLLKPHHK